MVPIRIEYKKNGYTWRQIDRNAHVAMYTNGTHFEVFKIKHVKAGEVFGAQQPAHEAVPGNEEWGVNAFTYMSEAPARQRFISLTHKCEQDAINQ